MTSGIIIRLQNLPWTANAEDIRRFFDALTIPDGGVHIIGGERGDAFIVFGSDEDARQAMLKDGGSIKNTPVKLLLSSRTEMQKVIDAAKQQALTSQNLLQTLAAASQQFNPSAAALQMPMLPQLMSMLPTLRNLTGLPGMPAMPNMPNMQSLPNMPAMPGLQGMPPFSSIPGMPNIPGMPMHVPGNMMSQNATNDKNHTLPATSSLMHPSIAGMPLSVTANMNDKMMSSVTASFPVIQTPMVSQNTGTANDKVTPSVTHQVKKDPPKSGSAQSNQNAKRSKSRSRTRSRSRSRDRRNHRDRYGKRDRKVRRSRSRSRDRYSKRSGSRERKNRDSTRTRDRNATSMKEYRRDSDLPKGDTRKTSSEKDSRGRSFADAEEAPDTAAKYEENGYKRRGKVSRFDDTVAENRDTGMARNYETNKEDVYGAEESRKATRYEEGQYDNRKYGAARNNYDEDNTRDAYGNQENVYPRKNAFRQHNNYKDMANYDNYAAYDNNYKNHENAHPPSHNYVSGGGSVIPPNTGSVCVEVLDIPWMTTEGDIKKFFSPLPIFDSSIKFKNDQFGRNRSVLVKFVNVEQKDQALLKNGYTISGQRVRVVEASLVVWESTEKCAPVLPRPQEPYVKVSFIPKRATRENIAATFEHAPDQLIVSKERNRESLVAYVKCSNLDDVHTLLKNKANVLICDSRVKVEPINANDFQAGQRDIHDPYSVKSEEGEETAPSYSIEYPPKRTRPHPQNDRFHYKRPIQERTTPFRSTCCLLKNLPPSVNDKEIVDFFGDINILPTQIHIMFNADYKQTGDGFCEFRSEADAEEALQKSHAMIRDRSVSVTLIPKEEVTNAIGVPKLLPLVAPGAALTDPTPDTVKEEEPAKSAASEEQTNVKEEMESETEKETTDYSTKEFEGEKDPTKLPSLFSQPVKPPPTLYMRPTYSEPPRPEYRARAPAYMPRHPTPMRKPPPFVPGCVVMLENVPYRAELSEIVEFFGEFNIPENHVIRRFNDWGQPTGDVRVSLRTPSDAQRAVRTLNGCSIRDRTITLSVV